ncbi:hypothetical protein B0H11DRAFT_1919177 [Mycena galericulata]|nr:hypothetical protein B0H11DRAFT_1919177 [Mycena galericulata]
MAPAKRPPKFTKFNVKETPLPQPVDLAKLGKTTFAGSGFSGTCGELLPSPAVRETNPAEETFVKSHPLKRAKATQHVVKLSPPSAAFVDARTTSLVPWVGLISVAFLSANLTVVCHIGVVFCQVLTFFPDEGALQQYYRGLVITVILLSMLMVPVPLFYRRMDFLIIIIVPIRRRSASSFFCLRTLAWNAKSKVMWLLAHLLAFSSPTFDYGRDDIFFAEAQLYGLERTTKLINRLLRLVFESAMDPKLATDLIMTLGIEAVILGKVYVVDLLYMLNCINEYRVRDQSSLEVYCYNNHGRGSRAIERHAKVHEYISADFTAHTSDDTSSI